MLNRMGSGTPLSAEVLEQGFRFAILSDAARAFGLLLEAVDTSLQREDSACCCGARLPLYADGKRRKEIMTLVGKVAVDRRVYVCPECRRRIYPLDSYLDIAGTCYTQSVQSIITRTASWESFETSSEWLYECAGLSVSAKSVERISETNGKRFMEYLKNRSLAAVADPPSAARNDTPVTTYIEMDGTGLPMRSEALKGRKGKQGDGSAKTREFKLGCVFTQKAVDDKGQPVRDPDSTSYIGGILDAQAFGTLLSGEALRRGQLQSDRLVIVSDGAKWIWNLAAEHFPRAIEIVDLYHALEHLDSFCDALEVMEGKPMPKDKKLQWKSYLEESATKLLTEAELVIAAFPEELRSAAEASLNYFRQNEQRMRYAEYRHHGLFVGSGVIEGGCKQVIAQRFKKSGMKWTLNGAEAIAALRLAESSGYYHEIWDDTRPNKYRLNGNTAA